jgi:hypothetical protein
MKETEPHLFSVDGFLGEEWFVRSYWIFGTGASAGWGGWARATSSAPSGRILAFDGDAMLGYGRTAVAGGPVGHNADSYHLWRRDRRPAPPAESGRKKGRAGRPGSPATVWSDKESLIVRAMVLARDKLLVAGPPDLGRKASGLLAFENEEEALAAFRGEKGVFLRVVSTKDGSTLAEHAIPALPVFDGMSVAAGRIFLALQNGSVVCWGGK